MSKQPTRLSDFQIPREGNGMADSSRTEPPSLHESILPVPVVSPTDVASPSPPRPAPTVTLSLALPQAETPPEIPRRALGARVPVPLAERLRAYLYVSRRSQQEVVEAALDSYLRERGA